MQPLALVPVVNLSKGYQVTEKTIAQAVQDAFARERAAIRTLEFYGFTFDGDTYWKPPVEGNLLLDSPECLDAD